MEISELTQECRQFKNALRCHYSDFGDYYTHTDNQAYEQWLAYTRRYLKTQYAGDEFVAEFEKVAKEKSPSPEQLDKMLAILEAIEKLPQVVKKTVEATQSMVTINNTQSQNQSQTQNIFIEVFVEALHEELSKKQIRELKAIAEDENRTSEEKKASIFDKIKDFGLDTLSGVIANVLSNPAVWAMI